MKSKTVHESKRFKINSYITYEITLNILGLLQTVKNDTTNNLIFETLPMTELPHTEGNSGSSGQF